MLERAMKIVGDYDFSFLIACWLPLADGRLLLPADPITVGAHEFVKSTLLRNVYVLYVLIWDGLTEDRMAVEHALG